MADGRPAPCVKTETAVTCPELNGKCVGPNVVPGTDALCDVTRAFDTTPARTVETQHQKKHTGCVCATGFAGPTCDECVEGYNPKKLPSGADTCVIAGDNECREAIDLLLFRRDKVPWKHEDPVPECGNTQFARQLLVAQDNMTAVEEYYQQATYFPPEIVNWTTDQIKRETLAIEEIDGSLGLCLMMVVAPLICFVLPLVVGWLQKKRRRDGENNDVTTTPVGLMQRSPEVPRLAAPVDPTTAAPEGPTTAALEGPTPAAPESPTTAAPERHTEGASADPASTAARTANTTTTANREVQTEVDDDQRSNAETELGPSVSQCAGAQPYACGSAAPPHARSQGISMEVVSAATMPHDVTDAADAAAPSPALSVVARSEPPGVRSTSTHDPTEFPETRE